MIEQTTTKSWSISEIIEATNGNLLCGDMTSKFLQIVIDSRTIQANDMFVAIVGEKYDGHNFVQTLIENGIKGILVQSDKTNLFDISKLKSQGITCVSVSDTVKALGDLARSRRIQSGISVVALTGSNGKTSTKEMTASVIRTTFSVLKTQGNLNNHIGLPLTLFQINQSHQWAVVELGMNHPGEIRYLADICKPNIAMITNIAPAHLEGVSNIEGVTKAKGELFEALSSKDTAIVNADDPRVMSLLKLCPCPVIRFGQKSVSEAEVKGKLLEQQVSGCLFTLTFGNKEIPIKLNSPGQFMISNALAAATVGYCLGISEDNIKAGLESFSPIAGRMQIHSLENSMFLINDTYNANPGSMSEAIETLRSLKKDHRGIFVVGDMFELGEHAEFFHKQIGEKAAKAGVSNIYATGKYAATITKGAIDSGMDSKNIFIGSKDDISKTLNERLLPCDWILVKGSRAMAMEYVVNDIIKNHPILK